MRAQRWGVLGAAVWAGLAVLARMGIARIGAIELMFLFGPLVIVPLGMELGQMIGGAGRLEGWGQRLQPLGAAFAMVAILLPPGRWAGGVALGWMVVSLLMAGAGLRGLVLALRRDAERSVRAILAVGRIDLAVGGAWLVASRLGMRPMGIQEPIGLLTAVHFHFAGFATATIAAATLQSAETHGGRQKWLRRVAYLVAGMPVVVAAGFVISPVLKMGAAIVFSASVAGLAIFVRARGRQAETQHARILLQVAAGAIFAGMVLSGAYAVADFVGSEVLTIPQMARTHGILNAIGFCLTGLLGWLVEKSSGQVPGVRRSVTQSEQNAVFGWRAKREHLDYSDKPLGLACGSYPDDVSTNEAGSTRGGGFRWLPFRGLPIACFSVSAAVSC
jgi:hypothetical protein